MKTVLLAVAALWISALSFGQTMMQSTGSSGGTGTMTAPNATSAEPMTASERRLAPSTGHKVIFSGIEDAMALAAKGPTVLMFAADWCPICQADLKDINANGSRLGDITVVVLDYDKEKALERKYAVTVQHTYVQIDSTGARVAIWSGGGVDGILSNVKGM